VEGKCLCGDVVFQIDSTQISLFNNCYCENCQRDSGAAFVSQLQVRKEGFHWVRGENLITHYQSSPGVFRAFCPQCGSRLPMSKQDNFVPVPAGLVSGELNHAPQVNMHLAKKKSWALVDESIHCLDDQGSDQFWRDFMQENNITPTK